MTAHHFVRRFEPQLLGATPAYETYWRFAAERQRIYFRRLQHPRGPWTEDGILAKHRFTNAYRASDRVSQFLIQNVIYGDERLDSPTETLFRILLFKFFNKVSTWQLLERERGTLTWQTFDIDRYAAVLSDAVGSDAKIYSAAYIIPPVKLGAPGPKHIGHLRLLDLIMRDGAASKIAQCRRWPDVFALLKSYPSLGDFLAFQLSVDINYSALTNFNEDDFVVAGPGARDGISKLFAGAKAYASEDIIRMMVERQTCEFERLGIKFRDLFGRELRLIDCQNLFCEVSKYTRISHPELSGVSGRRRIKQAYNPGGPMPAPWFPPKWGINGQVPKVLKGESGR